MPPSLSPTARSRPSGLNAMVLIGTSPVPGKAAAVVPVAALALREGRLDGDLPPPPHERRQAVARCDDHEVLMQ